MTNNFYQTIIVGPGSLLSERDVRDRWSHDCIQAIKAAIQTEAPLPRIFQLLKVAYGESVIDLEDLRGLDLSGTVIGDYDLSYCALDFCNMDNCVLEGTHFQYSRLVHASLRWAKLRNVQASPIDGRNLDISQSKLTGCYMTNSDLSQAEIHGSVMERCDFTSSNFTHK